MSINYQFKYMPLVGKLPGKSMAQQTETAINEIAEIVNENVAQAEIINTLAQDANNNSVEALEKANEALQTTGRVYVNVEGVVNLDNYCQSELLWIRNASSTNLPIQHSGFLEVKTNSDKTHAEQIFIDDSSGIVYSRAGTITAQQVGEVTNYVASYGEWVTIATNTYVTAELANYAPLASPAFTGTPTAPTPANNDNSTKVANTAFVKSIDSTCVHKTGEETITGQKTFNIGIKAVNSNSNTKYQTQITGLKKGIYPSSTVNDIFWSGYDSDGNRIATIQHYFYSSGAHSLELSAFPWVAETVNASIIFVGQEADGTNFTRTNVVPPQSSNGTDIATTSWVTTKLGNYLPLSGGNLTGVLTTEGNGNVRYVVKNNNFTVGDAETYNRGILTFGITDKNNRNVNAFYTNLGADGNLSFRIYNYGYNETQSQRILMFDQYLDNTSDFHPYPNNAIELGTASYRWKHLHCGGATLTDNLVVRNGGTISIWSGTLEKGVLPASDKYLPDFYFADKNGNAYSRIQELIRPSGDNTLYFFVNKQILSGSAGFRFTIKNTSSTIACFAPTGSGNTDLGIADLRWKEVFATTGTINTSDERLKDNIAVIPDTVLDAWGEIGWYQYQFKDAIEEKGENARLHTGTIAQRIKSVFETHGLDAFRYGLLCYDEWDADSAVRDEQGNILQPARPAGNQYSLRYEEALCMEAAYQRRRADRLEQRLNDIEHRLSALETL